ncbi:HAD-IA family hydrolase [Streptomyces sp. NPDC004267]|uniref:HAD-IA family hydrolase n=1 Tax=Streptomyces sp. NPDC004267 TaxID=3364694 RepID=UPI0036CEDB24
MSPSRPRRWAGVKAGILSNSVGLAPWNRYDGYELERRYDAMLLSEIHGMRKPEPEMYRLVRKRLGLRAEECVSVADTEHCLLPWADLGFATVHAVDPARTVTAPETLLGIPLTTGKGPDRAATI